MESEKKDDDFYILKVMKQTHIGYREILFLQPHLSLSYLDLTDVYFRNIIDVRQFTNLKTLILSNTCIEAIPKCPDSLEYLDISNNSIENACCLLREEDMTVIRNLKTLVIYGNKNIFFKNRIPLHILVF